MLLVNALTFKDLVQVLQVYARFIQIKTIIFYQSTKTVLPLLVLAKPSGNAIKFIRDYEGLDFIEHCGDFGIIGQS